MDLYEKVTASVILSRAKIVADPRFYSGRGANFSDVTDSKLEQIYQELLDEYGKGAAHAFALLVGKIPTLAAADFIPAFLRLGNNQWEWKKDLLIDQRGTYIGNDAQAFATSAASANRLPDVLIDLMIRAPFLQRHEEEYNHRPKSGPYSLK